MTEAARGYVFAHYDAAVSSVVDSVAGFFVPPLGIIDGSVLTAVGLLLMFAVIAQIPKIMDAVHSGKSIKLQKGDLEFEVSSERN